MSEILARRLRNQRLTGAKLATPADVVGWLCAVQAQDYRGALWAVAQRMPGGDEAAVEQALADRTIVRSWPMRGTLHFCRPEDLRWLLGLLAPRVIARGASRYRELGLDAKTLVRAEAVLREALVGCELARDEAYAALERGKVATAGQRGIHILGRLAMAGVLCFGAPRGKQQTFALLDDWIPESRTLAPEAALAELARRYVASHGPALLDDFAWWSGLPTGEARHAIELAGDALVVRTIAGATYHDTPGRAPAAASAAYLLPAYDEYTVGYRDRSAFLDPAHAVRAKNGIFAPVIVLDGRIAGTWKRITKRDRVAITAELFAKPTRAQHAQLAAEAERYGAFVGLPATFTA
ncbi:MAG: winged helix DNA-binding domain-containing protein [Kofleriaceae bacterium]